MPSATFNEAIAKIGIDTSGFSSAEKHAEMTSAAVRSSFNSLADAVQRATDKMAKTVEDSNKRQNRAFDELIAKVHQMNTPIGQASQEIDKMFGFATKKAEDGSKRIQTSINGISAAFGALGGLFAGKQLVDTAGQTIVALNDVERRFTAITGSQKEAHELMEQIRAEAERFGQSSIVAQKSLIALVPNLKGGTAELEKMTGLALRLASTNQEQGLGGAVRAINEALSSGELTSLVDRFNLSRAAIRQALQETGGDFAGALDIVLNKMGATEEAALAAGQQFDASARLFEESFNRAAAEGLKPFLDIMGQLLRGVTDFINQLRETNPGLVTMISGIGLAVTAGSGLILTLTQIGRALKLIQIEAPGAGKALGAALGATGGIEAGTGLVRLLGNAGVGGFEQFKGKSQEEAKNIIGDTVKQIMIILIKSFIDIKEAFDVGALTFKKVFEYLFNILSLGANAIKLAMNQFIEAFATLVHSIGKQIGGVLGTALMGKAQEIGRPAVSAQKEAEKAMQENISTLNDILAKGLLPTPEEMAKIKSDVDQLRENVLVPLLEEWFPKKEELPDGPGTMGSGSSSPFTQKQIDEWIKYEEKITEIDNELKADLIKAEADFQEDMLKKQNDFNLKRQRDLEDELERRRRAEQELNNEIAEIGIKRAQEEADLQLESEQKIQELTEESNNDQAEKLQDHLNNLAKIEREARRNILDAARNLDAEGVRQAIESRDEAVFEENQKYLEGSQEIQETLNKRIAEEKRSYERRLEEGRISDAREIDRLKRRFAEEEALRIADFNTKRQRELDDFNARRLAEMNEHIAKLNDMKAQADLERQEAWRNFSREFDQLTQHNNQKLVYNQAYYQAAEARLAQHLSNLNSAWNALITPTPSQPPPYYPPVPVPVPTPGNPVPEPYASGGVTDKDGLIYAHRGEAFINATNTGILNRMLGQEVTGNNLVAALRGRETSRNVNIQNFNPQLTFEDIGSYSREEIADIVTETLIENLSEAINELGATNG